MALMQIAHQAISNFQSFSCQYVTLTFSTPVCTLFERKRWINSENYNLIDSNNLDNN